MTDSGQSWINPVVRERADPHLSWHEGAYYFTATVPAYDRIELRRSATIGGLAQAEAVTIWRKHARGPMSWHIWAPELHWIDGRWYVYFAASEVEAIWELRIYVLECQGTDPLRDPWVEKGPVRTAWETFALDATTFVHRGRRYLAWAQRDPAIFGNTNLYLAPLANPWTLAAEPVRLSRPEYLWERQGFLVNEGPALLARHGRLFLTYSASATDHRYCMGLLEAEEDAPLLDPRSWRKADRPIFASDPGAGQFGPGHNSFTSTPDGKTDLLVYHARNYRDLEGDPLHNPDRHTRVQPLTWDSCGRPRWGAPLPDGPVVL